MRGYEIPDDVGYACGDALGLDAFAPMGHGQDGKVFALDDGRVLKVTLSPFEAACCRYLMDAGPEAPHAFPRVDHVARLDVDGREAFAIVREDAREIYDDPDEDDAPGMAAWDEVARHLAYAWSVRRHWIGLMDEAVAFYVGHVLPGLQWFAERTGCDLADLKPDNFGIVGGGRIVLRDLSRADDAPSSFLKPILATIPDLPSPAPSP